jgi:O-antigen ligase
LLILVLLAAAASYSFAWAERRVHVSPRARRAFALSTVGVAVVILIGVGVRFGGPPTIVEKGWKAFKAAPVRSSNLNERLLSFSGNGRYDLWRVAWRDAQSHPVLGSGAGSYERYFLQHQPATVSRVRDAHGLYIETLAELGPLGLVLLVVALLVPLAVAVHRRRLPLTGAAAGAYVVFLVHAGTDWDWELPAVTLAALLCAGSLVVGDRRSGRAAAARLRGAAVAAAVAAGALAGVGLLGNSALGSADSALKAGAWRDAAADANRARTWMPWSPQPWVALGRAELGAGSGAAARASFEKAVSMDSADWALWVDLARVTRGAEQRHALRKALALYPRAGFRVSPAGEITSGDTTP